MIDVQSVELFRCEATRQNVYEVLCLFQIKLKGIEECSYSYKAYAVKWLVEQTQCLAYDSIMYSM